MTPRWDDPAMFQSLDSGRPWGRKLRKHQSWYREEVLKVPPAEANGRPVPNRLRPEDVAQRPALNFLLNEGIVRLVDDRLKPKSPGWRGRIDEERLRHNLLTSQALCFNLFGFMSLYREEFVPVLRDLGYSVDEILDVRIEYNGGPQVAEWRPNSAFDAWVLYRSGQDERFLGVECKYHEDLAARAEDPKSGLDVFRDATAKRPDVFLPSAGEALAEWNTSQLWFNACLMLAAETEERKGTLVFASCRDDEGAKAAFRTFAGQLADESRARTLHYEDIIDRAKNQDELRAWAADFSLRYLDFDRSGGNE